MFFIKPGAARNVDMLQAARAQGVFAVLMVSGNDEIRGEIARLGLLVDGGFENAAYDLKYHLRGLDVQIFYRVRSALSYVAAANRFSQVSLRSRSSTDAAVGFCRTSSHILLKTKKYFSPSIFSGMEA